MKPAGPGSAAAWPSCAAEPAGLRTADSAPTAARPGSARSTELSPASAQLGVAGPTDARSAMARQGVARSGGARAIKAAATETRPTSASPGTPASGAELTAADEPRSGAAESGRFRSFPRRAWPWLRALIGVGILAVLALRLGTGAFLDGLRVLDVPSVSAALGIGLLTTVVSAIRWCVVARHLGLTLPSRTAIADYYQALFVNVTLPTGVLGDVQRAVGHGQRSGNVGRGVRAVVLERTGGQIVLFVLCALLLVAQPGVVAAVVGDFAVTAAVLGGVVVVVVGLVLWGMRSPRWRRTVGTTLADIRAGLLSRDTWPAVVGLSAVVLAGHLALFLVAARTAGVHAPVANLVTPIVLTLLASGLPVNIGGWGPRESVSVLAFEVAGLGAAQGLTVSVVYGVLTFAGALPGAVVLVARLRSRPKVQLEQRVLAEQETAGRRA